MALITFDEAMKRPEHFCMIDDNKKEYPGYFSNIRVDRRTLPEGWHAYDLREADWSDEGWFSTIEANYVMVNHAGTFLTKEELPLVEDKTGKSGRLSEQLLANGTIALSDLVERRTDG